MCVAIPHDRLSRPSLLYLSLRDRSICVAEGKKRIHRALLAKEVDSGTLFFLPPLLVTIPPRMLLPYFNFFRLLRVVTILGKLQRVMGPFEKGDSLELTAGSSSSSWGL